MKIRRIEVTNFKKFSQRSFDLHPEFTLLVGENGTGKTSVLDALAVALGVWLVESPDTTLMNSGRKILPSEIRLEAETKGDRIQFLEQRPVMVRAIGDLGEARNIAWTRQIRARQKNTSNADAREALAVIAEIYRRDSAGEQVLCPVLGYYGAGRAWLPSNRREPKGTGKGPARRWAAFYDCFEERIRTGDLQRWFHRETTAAGSRGGRMRPGFEAVKSAVLGCVPGANDLWFDPDRDEIVLAIDGAGQPFGNLSAGQRMMLSLVADIAIKAVTQNAHLLPPNELPLGESSLPRVLQETPGVILVDELDVHLHPGWQRRIITDLRRTFPAIQFICTTHSPFVIQALGPGELLQMEQGPSSVVEEGDSIEDIVEEVQGVSLPQRSKRADELAKATERYFGLLQRGDDAPVDELVEAEADYRKASEGFSTQPGLEAILKLEALAAKHKVR
jgi:predicted ATP-binding protein involved in virulence